MLDEKIYQSMSNDTLTRCLVSRDKASDFEDYMGFTDSVVADAASVHDIGKGFINPAILNKPSFLSDAEKNLIDMHPLFGYLILQDYNVSDLISGIVLYHHGDIDSKIKAAYDIEIPYEGNIKKLSKLIYTIDFYTALISKRPYRKAYTKKETYTLMEASKESFDLDFLKFIKECEL